MEKIIIFGVQVEPPKHKEKEEALKKEQELKEQELASNVKLNDVLYFMACQKHWNVFNMRKYVFNLAKIDRSIAIRLILKNAALMFDAKYPNHISKAKEVYLIDEYNSNDIIPCQPELYRIVPLFRNKREAEWALDAIKPLLKDE